MRIEIPEREAQLIAGEFARPPHSHSRLTHTYRLLEELLEALGGHITHVRLAEGTNEHLHAEVVVCRGRGRFALTAHPGDAALLAWRARLPLQVPAELAGDALIGAADASVPELEYLHQSLTAKDVVN